MIQRSALLTGIVSFVATRSSRPTGDGASPPGSGDERYPFVVVYAIPGGSFPAGILETHGDHAELVIQLSCVGRRRDQADALLDRCRAALLDHDIQIPVAGHSVLLRQPYAGTGGIDSSGQPPHRLFTATERFRIHVSST